MLKHFETHAGPIYVNHDKIVAVRPTSDCVIVQLDGWDDICVLPENGENPKEHAFRIATEINKMKLAVAGGKVKP